MVCFGEQVVFRQKIMESKKEAQSAKPDLESLSAMFRILSPLINQDPDFGINAGTMCRFAFLIAFNSDK